MTANISPLFRDVNKFAVLTCGKIGNKVTNMRYGERLRTARKARELTQPALAELAFILPQNIDYSIDTRNRCIYIVSNEANGTQGPQARTPEFAGPRNRQGHLTGGFRGMKARV